jgi:hypothetical protein
MINDYAVLVDLDRQRRQQVTAAISSGRRSPASRRRRWWDRNRLVTDRVAAGNSRTPATA